MTIGGAGLGTIGGIVSACFGSCFFSSCWQYFGVGTKTKSGSTRHLACSKSERLAAKEKEGTKKYPRDKRITKCRLFNFILSVVTDEIIPKNAIAKQEYL